MFCYQAKIAVYNLIDPPLVDSTQMYNIELVEKPLITICATRQYNFEKFKEFGYRTIVNEFLNGKLKNKKIAWGAQNSTSFEELLNQILYLNRDNPYTVLEGISKKLSYLTRFYPRFGWCADVDNYTIPKSGEAKFTVIVKRNDFDINKTPEAEVFLTDKKLRTRHTVHKESHWGSSIILKQHYLQSYMVEVKLLSYIDPRNPEECKDFVDDYLAKCVDSKLESLWKPVINCNPSWVSKHDQCKEVLNITEDIELVLGHKTEAWKTSRNIADMENFPAKEHCGKPCTVIRPTIIFNGKEMWSFGESTLILKVMIFPFFAH